MGFSLAEIMIAVVFISIGFFGYVALHSRILHSGQKLEEREVVRSGTDFFEAIEVARLTLGFSNSLDLAPYPVDSTLTDFHRISTDTSGRDLEWKEAYPPEFHQGIEQTMETAPAMLANPHKHAWNKR